MRGSAKWGLRSAWVVVALMAAPPATAATFGIDGTTVRLDASGETRKSELTVGFAELDIGRVFNTQSPGGEIQPGPGCSRRERPEGTIVCPSEGISVVEIRGPRSAPGELTLGLYEAEGSAPNATGLIDAGAEQDTIQTMNDTTDTISCGGGLDTVRTDARDAVQADCERSGGRRGRIRARLLPGHPVNVRAPSRIGAGDLGRPYGIDFKVTCPRSTPDDSCGGKLDVFVAERTAQGRTFFGSQVYAIDRGETRRVRVSVGVGAADGQTAASYTRQILGIRAALKKRGRARMRAQVRSGSSRFQHRFSVRSIRTLPKRRRR